MIKQPVLSSYFYLFFRGYLVAFCFLKTTIKFGFIIWDVNIHCMGFLSDKKMDLNDGACLFQVAYYLYVTKCEEEVGEEVVEGDG